MVTAGEVAVVGRLRTGRGLGGFVALALMVAPVRPAAAPAAAAGDTTHVTLGKVNALFGPNQGNLGFFDVDAFHQLSATDIFNTSTFEPTFPEAVFNPPAGVGPRCSNATGVNE